ncbi:MAG: DUF262 domain-containing protein [Candidatus Margulisbacteria bacterium]|nr:DUF262 domain-containing protein [Candidatus Margulisiibacteriota bacterium]
MAIWKSNRIADIITEIEEEKYVLPVIQRRLVWDEEKMELLFDTLLKGDSFGGIMVIEEERDTKPLFNYRPFTKDGEMMKSRQIDKLPQLQNFVIDGQQRLQAFYIGLKGSLNGKVLFFDLFSDYHTEYEFKFESDEKKLPKNSVDNNGRTIQEHKWYLTSTLLRRLKDTNDEDQVANEIIQAHNIIDELKKTHIIKNIKAFYKNIITAEALGVSKVIINKTLHETSNRQRIVELFRRLNDGGTKLSPFDLVASILKGFEWEMESFLDEVLTEFQDIGLNQDNLIKLIFLLQDNHKKEMSEIEASDAEFAISKRDRIRCALTGLRNFLINADLANYYKEGNKSFIPLFFIAYHIFHKQIQDKEVVNYFDDYDANNSEFPKMKKWLYYSLLNGVFRSKGAGWIPYKTGIRKILEEIKKAKNTVFPIKALFQIYYDHGISFTEEFDISKLELFETQFMYYLIYDKKQTVRIQDIDHIMPKSILESMNYNWDKINSICNFQLLDSGTNRGLKNGKPFKEWIDNYIADKPAYISKHLIPSDKNLWTENKYDLFIETRAKMILAKIIGSIN